MMPTSAGSGLSAVRAITPRPGSSQRQESGSIPSVGQPPPPIRPPEIQQPN